MNKKGFVTAAVTIFSIVGLLHLVRALYAWEMTISGVIVPVWVSWVAFVILGSMVFYGMKR